MRPAGPGTGILVIVAFSLLEIAVAFAIVAVAIGWAPSFRGIRHPDFIPRAIAPLEAGRAPRIAVDDGQSRVIVEPSRDGLVHVTDQTWFYGGVWSTQDVAQLQVRRTRDGVSISRPQQRDARWFWFGFGEFNRAIEIDVPAHAVLSVVHCAGATVDGLAGDVDVWSDDGHIEARDITGGRMNLHSDDGRIVLTNVSSGSLIASTDDGSITLALPAPGNATIAATTDDGSIRLNGERIAEDGIAAPLRLGNGAARIRLVTDDGSIRIATNGAF